MAISKKYNGPTLFDLTSFVAATPANRLASPANATEQMTQDTCGHGYETPLAIYNPATQSWKMSVATLALVEQPSLENLPPSGMTRNGVLYRRPQWEPLIDETGSLSWPTPRASAAMSDDMGTTTRRLLKSGYKSRLEEAVAMTMWPTPRAAQGESRNHTVWLRSSDKPQNLENRLAQVDPSTIGGKLNPMWVEWLMGFPLGWTDLEDSETP